MAYTQKDSSGSNTGLRVKSDDYKCLAEYTMVFSGMVKYCGFIILVSTLHGTSP